MKLYNTLSREVEEVTTVDKTLSFYTCGPTVYDFLTVGNWTAYLRWDVLARVLRSNDFDVQWVMNITDVGHLVSDADEGEDKLEKGAKREGKSAWEVADYYTQDFMRGLKMLGIEMGENSKIVKATDHIPEQIELIKTLESKSFTYIIKDGVYFDTTKLADYGKLARLDIAGLQAGKRVNITEKRSVTDFALWKFSPKGKKRDMEWESPWGIGFPGWHIECSAMSMKYLGETIDIHTGGIDHIPVHHSNEIAQSEAATGKTFVRYWVHSNFLQINSERIAKSAGNGFTLRDVSEKGFDGQDLRMLILQSHYRNEANFTWELLEGARQRRLNWKAAASLQWQPVDTSDTSLNNILDDAEKNLRTALSNDLATPAAFSIIDEALAMVAAKKVNAATLRQLVCFLSVIKELLGIHLFDNDIAESDKQLLTLRLQARKSKDYEASDKIRSTLLEKYIAINDSDDQQFWYRTK